MRTAVLKQVPEFREEADPENQNELNHLYLEQIILYQCIIIKELLDYSLWFLKIIVIFYTVT